METIKLPVQRIDAALAAADANRDERSVPMTFYSGATVLQFSLRDGLHNLRLSLDPQHVRIAALNSGTAPFTLGHRHPNDPAGVIGVIKSASVEGKKGRAQVKFSKRPEAEAIFQDVMDGIYTNVSVEARIHKLKDVTKEGDALKTFMATDWEPFAVALVSVGADGGAHFTASEQVQFSECEIEFADERATSPEEAPMPETQTPGEAARIDVDEVKAAAATAERGRVLDINKIVTLGKLDAAFANQHISAGTSVEEVRRLAFEALAARSAENPTRTHHAEVVRDERETLRLNAGAVVMNLFDRKNAVDKDNEFRGMGILRLAEEILTRTGTRTRGMTKAQIVELSMMHNTSDFPLILGDSARKQMLAKYAYAQPTYKIWAKASTTPDFKTMSRLRLSETPTLLTVAEGAQITLGTMTESREQYALSTYGRGVSFTRQMLINDDLNAFNDLLGAFGVQASRLENQTVYAVLTANPTMSDSVALFDNAHANQGSGAIGNTGLDSMMVAMATQKGMDGLTVLNISPRYLLVPRAKQMTARVAMAETGPNLAVASQNWFAGQFEIVSDAALDASSTAVWYGVADPAVAPAVEYAHLEGAEGPQFITKENEAAILGVNFYCYIDFGAKAVDWRAVYKSTGV